MEDSAAAVVAGLRSVGMSGRQAWRALPSIRSGWQLERCSRLMQVSPEPYEPAAGLWASGDHEARRLDALNDNPLRHA
jgi:hypothetical protein